MRQLLSRITAASVEQEKAPRAGTIQQHFQGHIPARGVCSGLAMDRGPTHAAPARRVSQASMVCVMIIGALMPASSRADARQAERDLEAADVETGAGARATLPTQGATRDMATLPSLPPLPTRAEWSDWTPACRATLKQFAEVALVMAKEADRATDTELATVRFINSVSGLIEFVSLKGMERQRLRSITRSTLPQGAIEPDTLMDWSNRLDRIRQDDPEEALRPRIDRSLSMPLCRASWLAALCDDLTDVFAPVVDLEPAGTVSPEAAP